MKCENPPSRRRRWIFCSSAVLFSCGKKELPIISCSMRKHRVFFCGNRWRIRTTGGSCKHEPKAKCALSTRRYHAKRIFGCVFALFSEVFSILAKRGNGVHKGTKKQCIHTAFEATFFMRQCYPNRYLLHSRFQRFWLL